MKIFGFFVDQSKRLMALVILIVLLTVVSGIVSGSEFCPESGSYFSEEDCPICEQCGIEYLPVHSSSYTKTPSGYRIEELRCHYGKGDVSLWWDWEWGGALSICFYTDEELTSDVIYEDAFGVDVENVRLASKFRSDMSKSTIIADNDEIFKYEVTEYRITRHIPETDTHEYGFYSYNINELCIYQKRYAIYVRVYSVNEETKNNAMVSLNELVKCAKEVVDKKEGISPEKKVVKPDKTSCKDFYVDPKDFDLTYDNNMLRKEFLDFLKDYGSKHKLKSASDKYAGSNPLNQRSGSLTELGYFLFTTNLEEVKGSKFMTGKENELGKRIDERFKKEGRPLTPAEIFEESLKINDNHVLDSLLTSHNYLKQAAYDFREPKTEEWKANYNLNKKWIEKLETELEGKGVLDPFGQIIESQYLDEDAQKMIKQLDKFKKEVEELENFRENAEMKFKRLKQLRKKEDNVGACYHLFATLTMGYVVPEVANNWWGSSAYVRALIWGEHRFYKGIYKWKDYDKVEYCWDVWGGYLGGEIYSTLWDNQEKVKEKIKENPEPWKGSVWEKKPGYIQNAYMGQKI